MNNWNDSCEVFIMAPQLWESLTVFYHITRSKVTHQIISLPTHGPQHICTCGKFMCTWQTLDMQSFVVELVHAHQTHFPLLRQGCLEETTDTGWRKKWFSRNYIAVNMLLLFIYFFVIISLSLDIWCINTNTYTSVICKRINRAVFIEQVNFWGDLNWSTHFAC